MHLYAWCACFSYVHQVISKAIHSQSKQEFARSCGTCARPFTVFRWNPGNGSRYKTTVICQTCAKIKNVCQTCLLDLEYGLPTQVRDTALALQNEAPTSDINREYYAQNMEGKVSLPYFTYPCKMTILTRYHSAGRKQVRARFTQSSVSWEGDAKTVGTNRPLLQAQPTTNLLILCKGRVHKRKRVPVQVYPFELHLRCHLTRNGRHEKPADNDMAKQNIQDRYHGRNDPVARKILTTHAKNQGLEPPEDKSVVRGRYPLPMSHANQMC